jgi:hypothetical protein
MPIITTKILGKEDADPRPVTGVNYAGEPMKPGDYYNGRPEHQGPHTTRVERAQEPRSARKHRRKSVMSPERRKAFGDRMRAYWAKRKAQPSASDTPN